MKIEIRALQPEDFTAADIPLTLRSCKVKHPRQCLNQRGFV